MIKIGTLEDAKNFILSIGNYSDEEIFNNVDTFYKQIGSCNHLGLSAERFLVFAIRKIKNIDYKIALIKRYFFYGTDKYEGCYDWVKVMASIDNLSKEEQIYILRMIPPEYGFEEETHPLKIPTNLKFGLEMEFCRIEYPKLKKLIESGSIRAILESAHIPENIIDSILSNCVCPSKKTNAPSKWVFYKEGREVSEASTPIIFNDTNYLNQVKAVCTMFGVLRAITHGGTGLHINIGADYLNNNIEALKYLLRIWAEAEAIFFKIANAEGDTIRCDARSMALPIKAHIQKTLREKPSFSLDSEDGLVEFLYKIQVRDRLHGLTDNYRLREVHEKFDDAKNLKERLAAFKEYLEKETIADYGERFVSMNFSHFNWGRSETDRIEFRLFNSSLNFDVIMQNLLLVSRLFETAVMLASGDKEKLRRYSVFLNVHVTEEEKLNFLLDLLFDSEEEKEIYRRRYKSIEERYLKEYKSFYTGKNTFIPKY